MKKIVWVLLLFAGSFGIIYCSNGQTPAAASTQKIIIIRHGEKPAEGDNLSCQGFNRALQLPNVLYKKYGVPASVFVPSINTGKNTSTARMYQTIIPFAIKYNLTINTKYDVDDAAGLAASLQKKEGVSLVVWEHKAIDNIVKALGITNVEKWPGDDFDSIWMVTIQNGKASLTKDKEGLSPASSCQ